MALAIPSDRDRARRALDLCALPAGTDLLRAPRRRDATLAGRAPFHHGRVSARDPPCRRRGVTSAGTSPNPRTPSSDASERALVDPSETLETCPGTSPI